MSTDQEPSIIRDDDAGRYVLEDAPDDGFLEFGESENSLTLTHTEVADHREGQGVGSALVRFALDDADQRRLTVVPRVRLRLGLAGTASRTRRGARYRSGLRLRPHEQWAMQSHF